MTRPSLDQIRQGMRVRTSQARADSARSTNPQGVHLTGVSQAFRDPEPDPEKKTGWGKMFLEAINPLGDFHTGVRRGIAKGVVGAVDETLDFATTVAGFGADVTGLGEKYGGQDFLDWWAQDDDDRNPMHIGKDIVDDMIGFRGPDTIVGGLVEGITQFAVGMVGAGKLLKLRNVSKLGKSFVRGAAADAVVFDANEERLGNLLTEGPAWLRNPLTEFVGGITAAKESDDELMGKLKNALEGVMLGGLIHGLGVTAAATAKWSRGDHAGARILAREFEEESMKGVVELPNGKARLAAHDGDEAAFLTEVPVIRPEDPRLTNLPVIDDGLSLPDSRRFEFIGANGEKGAMEVHMDGDQLVVDSWGRLVDADAAVPGSGRIDVNPQSGFDTGRKGLRKIGGELAAEFPQAKTGKGLRLKSGKVEVVSMDRYKQEVFESKGDAMIEAVSGKDMRAQAETPLRTMGKETFADMEKLVEAYRTNRPAKVIKKMEKQLVENMRTNMDAAKEDIGLLITDIAKALQKAEGGSRAVMKKHGDAALSIMKGGNMEGILKWGGLSKIEDVAVVRRAAGLVMESLGQDVKRYSVRMNHGGSNLSVVQLGRALDQMTYIEEILTGKPAVWLDKHRKLYGEGRGRAAAPGTSRAANMETPEGPKTTTDADIASREHAPLVDDDGNVAQAVDNSPEARNQRATDKAAARNLEHGGDPEKIAKSRQDDFDRIMDKEGARHLEDPNLAAKQAKELDDFVTPPPAGVAPGPASLRNMSKAEILEVGRWVALADGDPRAIMTALKALRIQALASAGKPGMKQALLRWRLSAMLSGVSTQAVNVVSTSIQTALLPTELLVGGALSGSSRAMREGASMYIGLLKEMGDAAAASHKAFKAGKGRLDPGFMSRELDAGRFSGWMSAANLPQDFLTSADEFFKVLNYRAKIRAKSLRQSAEAGLSSADAGKRMIDDLEASISADGTALNTEALEYSRKATFTDELTGSAKKLSGVLHSDDTRLGVVGQLFVPFIRTPHNIMRNIALRTPGLQNLSMSHNRAIMAGGMEGAEAMGRMVTAGALAGGVGVLIAGNRITGRGPLNKDVRAAWKAAGFEPYTIQFGDNIKINYNRLSSLFGPMAMMADLHYAAGHLDPDEALEGVAAITASMLTYVSDQGFVGNMSEMFDTIVSGDAHAMTQFMEKTAIGMAVPQALSQFTGIDDTMREAEGFIDELYKAVPGLSDRLPPQRNIFREPVMKAPGSLDRIFNPFTQVGPTDNNTALALFRVGKQMALPGDTKFDGRVDLRDSERWGEVDGMSPYEYWQEHTAKSRYNRKTLKQELTALVNSSSWARMPEGSEDWPGGPRFVAVARIVKRRQEAGERAMMNAFPRIRTTMIQERMLKRFGDIGGRPATDRLQRTLNRRGQR